MTITIHAATLFGAFAFACLFWAVLLTAAVIMEPSAIEPKNRIKMAVLIASLWVCGICLALYVILSIPGVYDFLADVFSMLTYLLKGGVK